MRHALALALIALSITGSGCALVEDSCRNICVGFKTPIEEHREKARNRQWAEAAWQQVVCSSASGSRFVFSEDYAQGFKDGFAEYLYRGGDGEPPLIAPLRYRDAKYQNERGYHAVQDWFAGYRHGSTMARESGARKWIVGPSSLQAELDELHHPPGPPPADNPFPAAPPPIPLPQPKVLPGGPVEQGSAAPLGAKFIGPEAVETPAPKGQLDQPRVQPVQQNEPPLPEAWRLQIRRVTQTPRETAQAEVNAEQPQSNPARSRIMQIFGREPVPDEGTPTPEAAPPKAPDANPAQPPLPSLPPLPESVRLRIQKISEAAPTATPDEAKVRITGVQDAPPPARARITGIVATPQKD